MRLRATIERRKDRYEFVYKYCKEISVLLLESYKSEKVKIFVDSIIRPELSYNPNTYWVDIWFSIRNDYKKVFKN